MSLLKNFIARFESPGKEEGERQEKEEEEKKEEQQEKGIRLKWKYDVYMVHSYGKDKELAQKTRFQALELRRLLEEKGMRVCPEDEAIVKGLRRSPAVIVYVNKDYVSQLANEHSQASKEVKEASRRGGNILIPVVFDENLKRENWFGCPGVYYFEHCHEFNMYDEETMRMNLDRLCEDIEEKKLVPRYKLKFDLMKEEELFED